MSRENYSSEPEEFIASLKEKLEELNQSWLEKYTKLLNLKAISGKDQKKDMKIIRSSLRDFISLCNQYRNHYLENPQYLTTWGEASGIVNNELQEENNKLTQIKHRLEQWKKRLQSNAHLIEYSHEMLIYTIDNELLQGD